MVVETYTPDNLIAGLDYPTILETVEFKDDEVINRGDILGKDDNGAYAVVTADNGLVATRIASGVENRVYKSGVFNSKALILSEGVSIKDIEDSLYTNNILIK
jgi:hypothetical protein